MARIPDAFIDELLARTDIVDVISARVPLKKQGREFSARCPFHDERSPSFTVSPTKQFYHCFGCGANGTALRFLMEYERLEFLDAIDELAKRAGMQVPRDTRQRNANPETQPLLEVVAESQRFFQQQLAEHATAQMYLRQRGLDEAIIQRYGIGYAPEGYSNLRDALGGDAKRMKLLEKAGMFSANDRGNIYDKFRHRIMFPIHDRRGRVIAFGGRVIHKDDAPKYLNSPETPLFHKGRELYGLWQVRQAVQKIEQIIVTEGYMDVVALAQHGVDNAVATLGTATTPEHAELLFRNAPDVVFCFDGDNAGRRAAVKAMESVLPRMRDGRQALFLFLPDGEDPDSLVRREGADGFNARVREAVPLSQFFFDTHSADVNLSTLDGKARLAERVRPLLGQIPDGAFADLMRQRLTELTGVGASSAPAQTHVPAQRASRHHRRTGPAPRRTLVRAVIELLMQRPALALHTAPPYPFANLQQPGVGLLLELLDAIHARPDISTGGLLEQFESHEQIDALHQIARQQLPGDEAVWVLEFTDALNGLARQARQQRIEALQSRLAELDDTHKQELRELLSARG